MNELARLIANLPPEKRAEMLRRLEQRGRAKEARPPGPALPLSFAQQRLWLHYQLEPGSVAYNLTVAFRILGALDGQALERSLHAVVERHESLRTTFRMEKDSPVQVVSPDASVRLERIDLGAEPAGRRDERIHEHVLTQAQRPFELGTGPLLRASLFRLDEREHVLVLCMHHIVTDGWSFGVLLRELLASYDALVAGKAPELPPLPIQYPQFAQWQRERLQGSLLEEQLGYWRERLAGAPAALELPTSHPRPPGLSGRGDQYSFTLPRALAEAVKAFAAREGATSIMVLKAAWHALLSRYSGQEDLCVGLPSAGRDHADLERLIGFFVNTLVVRTRPAGSLPFRDFLRQVREAMLGALAHQELPLQKLLEELRPPREPGRTPLFQVSFSAAVPVPSLTGAGLELHRFPIRAEAAAFELGLVMAEHTDGFTGRFDYSTDLFEPAALVRMAEHLVVLLEAAVAAPGTPLAQLPLMSEAERRQVLVEWNETEKPHRGEHCIHELFAAQAARTPEAVALTFGGQSLTYRELEVRANQLAHALQRLEVGPETPVALCVQPSFEMVIGLLAVLKAGGAYVPLDPAWPRERLTFVLEDTRAPVLLTQTHLLDSLPAWPGHLVQLDAEGSSFAANSGEAPAHRTTPDNLAYIIYTSGSTGRPKGVMVPHRGVPNLVEALAAGMDVRPGSRVLQFASFSFDASVIELIVTLLSGATVCLAPRKELLPGPGLLSLLREQAITTAMFPPSLLALLSPEGLDGLHTVASGGEACSSEVVARWATSQRRFLNAYGPTEITVAATLATCTPDGQRPPLGRPLRNVKLYVLDRHLRPVPVGVPGELFIGGLGVTRGYLRRPELTAERFLCDPFSAVPGARMYRSGDLVRYRPDGTLDFLGRTDFQVKVRGFRIELGEIEAALAQHPAVRQALVLAREDRPGDKRLVAYLVTAQEPAPAELRAFLNERLPEHMVPSAFVFLERMPLTSSGKVDRKALPAPDAASSGAPFVAPRTPTEELLAGIWAEVLGQPRVGVEDDFFALGGHSLLATQVLSRVRTAFSVDVPVRTLFEAPTVAGLAQQLELAQGSQSLLQAPLPPPLPRTGEWPLSFAQQRLWFLEQLAPGSPLYTIPSAVRLGGSLDVSALSRGLQELLRRHDALRTTFASREGGPVQLIAGSLSIPLDVLDVAHLPPSEREARARELARQEALRPFDLERGPLVRTTLLRLAPEEHVLLLTLHHIASDGWSMSVLVRELAALYEAFSSGQPPSLPALSLQYADFALWQRSWLQGEVLQTQLNYWKQQLAGAPLTLELPTDHPRPPIQTHRGARHLFTLPPELSEALTSYSRQQGVTLFMTLLGAFQALLHRYSGQDDIVIGSPIAGRNRAELEGLIGFFVNTLALRTHLGDAPSFRALLARVRETTLGAYAHQDLPFEKLVEELQPARDLSRPPLFQVLFALQNLPPPVRPAAGLTLETLEPESGVAKFDLSLYVQETPRGLRGVLEYNTDLFEAATVVRLAGHFQTLLAGAIARPELPVSQLPLLSEDERHRLLVEWNDTGTGFPREACIHELIEAQAARTPEAPALIDGTRTLTHAELDRRANQLAHALRALGVGPESRVGICVRRSADVGVALLGILKAGAAYVPLDASWPRERLGYMLEDSGARVLVTQGLREDTLPSSGTAVTRLDLDAPAVTSQSTEKPPCGAVADNLAYLIYTSGSTGRPKGVQVPHRTVSNFFTAMDARLQVPARGVWLAVTSISFDISVLELLWTLSRGFTVVVREDTVGTDWLPEAVHRHGVTHLQCTPSLARALVQDPASAKALRHLRQMLVGGEALSSELARELRQHVSSLLNMYGPTETTVWSSTHAVTEAEGPVPLGTPIANTQLHVLDERLQPVPVGIAGELYIGGEGVVRGYLGRPELTAERFLPHPFSAAPGARLYRTGDRARWRANGTVEFLGRVDFQVKVRGFRIELGEVEAALEQHPVVRQAVVVTREEVPGDTRLVAYLVIPTPPAPAATELRSFLLERLPEYMVPSAFVALERLPLTPNGKVDRKALPAPGAGRLDSGRPFEAPRTETEQLIANAWKETLQLERVGLDDPFFALGGNSLLAVQLHRRLQARLGVELALTELFQYPTVRALAQRLARREEPGTDAARSRHDRAEPRRLRNEAERIAIVGLSGRFPGARDLESFWDNLRRGAHALRTLSDAELEAAGVSRAQREHPDWVRAAYVLDEATHFDAGRFGYSPREAELMDPQQRLFLECSLEALEDAGYDPERSSQAIGVFASTSLSSYLLRALARRPELMETVGAFGLMLGNDKDYAATRVAHRLGLRGPALNVQTACSSSLVAIHYACQSLLSGECDMALSGAATVSFPQGAGYPYQPGMIASPDGLCRAYDERAQGTAFGAGAAVVVLKRLSDALRDRDTIHAVILGSAVNNDGPSKVGFTAPSVEGQTAVISNALAAAGVEPGDIQYVEGHGTGTALGDPIEVSALNQAFGGRSLGPRRCVLGSLKANLGHLDAAAGVAGLMKTVLALKHRTLPPTAHFQKPNPSIDFDGGPFHVLSEARPWGDGSTRRRAGVSSFGIGGTNAHVVLEEAPAARATASRRPWHVLALSARTGRGLEEATARLATHLERHPGEELADVAYTLQVGRRPHEHRRVVLCRDMGDARAALGGELARRGLTSEGTNLQRPVVFLFPGQGSQHLGMGRALYETEPVFREHLDACCDALVPHLGRDLREVLYPAREGAQAEALLHQTALTQPALFSVQYALAQLWRSLGVEPEAMIGHSLGEYVAACLAGVFSLEDALALVAARGRLMQSLPPGAMLSVHLPEAELTPLLPPEVSIAAVNAPSLVVASGTPEGISALEALLTQRGVENRRLRVSLANHSPMVEPLLEAFLREAARVRFSPPRLPYVSSLTGTWVTAEQATDARMWARHLRQPVRFQDGAALLLGNPERVFLEVGPGRGLGSLVRQCAPAGATPTVLQSLPLPLPLPHAAQEATLHLTETAARLWLAGARVELAKLYGDEPRRRVPLPTYPFQRERYDLLQGAPASAAGQEETKRAQVERQPGERHPRPPLANPYVPPRDETEERVAGLWQELLGLERVGITDDFFELGGHSLLATQVLSRIRAAFSVDVPMRALFEAPTVEGLARKLELAQATPSALQAPLPPPTPRTGEWPLSFSQQRLWFLDQLEPGSPLYNIPTVVRLAGPLDVSALTRALEELVRRHETLRTTFITRDESPVQSIAPSVSVPLERLEVQHLPPPQREARVRELARDEALRPFDLVHGPLLRTTLLRLAPDEHVLLLVLHHIISDGWSMGVLVREVAQLYAAFASGRPPALPPLSLQYVDFALWHRSWLQGEVLEAQLGYWQQRFAGQLPILDLPTDRPRPPVQTFRGTRHHFSLPPALSEALGAYSRQHGVTLFMTLLAAFQTLLHRYSGQEDIVVGSPIAGRNRAELEGLIGFFVNTLALRTDLGGSPSFQTLLARVREVTLGAYAHQDLPFEKLVEKLQPARDLSRSPIFQVMFALQNIPLSVPSTAGLTLTPLDLEGGVAMFDLSLTLQETPRGLRGWLEYNTDLFEAATVVRLAEHFQTLLAGALARPELPVSQLPLLSEAERHRLLVEWNDTHSDYPREACVHELVEAHSRARPDSLAVADKQRKLTYRELDERANQLAHHLRGLGVGPESVGVVCVERSVDFIVGALAILKAGGAYLPVDVAYPAEWQRQVVGDSGAKVVLTRKARAGRVEGAGAAVVCLDEARMLEAQPKHRPESGVCAENLAYSIYTSGSTGRPKGVAVTHRSLVNLGRWYQEQYGVKPEDRATLVVGLSFDVSVWEVWLNLMAGASVHMPEDEVRLEPRRLPRWLAEERITVSFMATPMAEAVLEERWPEGVVLRWLFTGGDKLHRRPRQELKAALVNVYGPAENTVATTICQVEPEGMAEGLPHIGRPLANVRVYVLDGKLAPVPVGVWGELYIGGENLGRGYLERPALTAERFIPNPFEESGARMYRTGDVVRYLPDGNIEFRGRNDFQVKIRGFRIELGEIQSVLDKHPGVRQSVVLVREDVPGNKRLVAYWVAQEGQEQEASELREHLKQKLPAHMVPSAFVKLEKVPLTPNGKVDRKALPAPDFRSNTATFLPPSTPTEQALAGLWRQLLGLERVGAHDNFFALGGHSLLATRLASRLRATFGVELHLRELFESPTLSSLASRIDAARGASPHSGPPLVPQPREGALPLSFAQQRLWFLDQLEPGSPLYNIPAALLLEGPLDVPALEASLHELLRRHESLRTVFPTQDGQPVQVILPPGRLPLSLVDLSALPEPQREQEAHRLVREAARHSFHLASHPALHLVLLKLAPTRHLLVLVMHHIVTDGWSMSVLVREVAALYAAFSSGRAPSLPPLPLQYPDFALWQRSWLQGEVLSRQLDYWKQQLSGAPLALELPTDRPRPPVQTHRGAQHSFLLPPALSESLNAYSRQQGVTLFMTLLAAFQTLLHRYSGQEDIIVGSPIAGRNRAELEGLIGFFVNTLALRTRLGDAPSFRTLLARVRETTLSAYAHQDLPFEKLVEELQPARDLSRSPIFQVMFALQNAPDSALSMSGLSLTPLELESGGIAKFDLSLTLRETPEGLRGGLEYNTDLFDAETVARMAGHFHTLLAGALARPELPVSQLPLLSEAERHQLLVEWNDTHSDYPREACVHEVFEARVAARPEAVAVELGEHTLSYRELDEKANQLAHLLRARGVGPDARVALCLERSVELVVALVGILKAGGAYVPLDVTYPRERLASMLEDTRPRVLVTTRELAGKLPAEGLEVLYLEEEAEALAAQPKHAPRSGTHPRNLAYIDFTSGSTGRPKGVGTEHGSVLRTVLGARYAQLGPDETFLLIAPISFDASTLEVWGCLLNGGRLVVYPPQPPGDVKELEAVLRRHSVTVLHLTAGLFTQMVDANLEGLRGVRQLLTGGDVVSAPHVRKVLEELRIPVTACYGPTESTLFTTCHRMTDAGRVGPVVPIGTPIGNTQVYVLDGLLRPVPVGTAGELYIGGEGLARGYLEQPGLTAERFLPNPYGAPGARMYRTGDLARWRPDGVLEFLGRGDNQVKVRGFRVEPGEVESALGQCPGVRECVVVARGAGADGKRLVAYVVGAPGESLEASALRSNLKARLPEYMVPSAFVLLEALPLTLNGKVDRKSLPAPEASKVEVAAGYVAPRMPTEEVLASVFAQVLGVRQVGANDSFFELGGHSLLAARAISRLYSIFGVELPVRVLFEAPTVAELAARIDDALQRESSAAQLPPLVPQRREGALPLSFAQQRLWFLDQLQPGSPLYNMPAALLLEGALDVPALEATFQELLRRHESLRTVFPTRDGEPVQVILPPGQLPLSSVDLSALPESEREQEARRLVQEAARHSFLLASHLPLHLVLVKLSPTRHLLVLVMHHIVSDGWSMSVLVREVAALYAAFSSGGAPSLPPLPLQYPDFALWQRSWLRGEVLQAQLDYWKQQLSGAPLSLELPTDRPRPPVQSYRGAQHSFQLPAALSESLNAYSRQQGVTLFMTLLAAFQTLLHRYSGQEDIIVGSPIAGRNRAELEGLIGFFVNTLALRTRLGDAPSFRTLLARVRETTLSAYAHQDLPFEKLVEELQPARDLSRSPIFQVMFALQNAPDSALSMSGLSLTPLELESGGIAKFDLSLTLRETPEGLRGGLEYNTDLFDAETVARMAGHFHTLLAGALARPELPVSQLPLLSEAERHQLLVEWNDTHSDYPREACVHEVFEARVAARPEAVAVELGERTLSYRELDEKANQLAHLLRARGVGPDSRVALCLERSVELVVALVGILKAGGAYVPLDVTYPRERLASMLEDTRPCALVTTRELAGKLPAEALAVVYLEEEAEALAAQPTHSPRSGALARNLAYIDFTSGSTGRPKGVGTEHGSVLRTVLGARYAQLGPDETFLLIAPISFDASTLEVWGCLLNGGRLVVYPPQPPGDVKELEAVLRRHSVTVLHLTAGLFTQMVDANLEGLRGVRQLLTGGDVVSAPHVRKVLEELRIPVTACYGPTEGTLFTTCHRMTDAGRVGPVVPIGTPIGNTQVYVLDGLLRPVPVGTAGELYIGGEGLARGYLEQPGLTAERFLPNPYGAPGARMYRTGDLARWRPDGVLEFLGRGDNQVKVRGFRVELGEVESALALCPGVRECVVVARGEGADGKRLVAYVVGAPGEPLEASALRSNLKARLPEYMVPSAFVVLEALPLTPNGKVDRKSLPAPDASGLGTREAFLPPRHELEWQLVQLWEEVLDTRPIGVRHDFFELGGHSLLAARLAARVEQLLGLRLSVLTLFQHPTVEQLATELRREQDSSGTPRTLVRLRAGEPHLRPLFLVHGGGGGLLGYAELVRQLEPARPIYGLNDPEQDGGEPLPASVEEMARHYVARLREVQPAGPYFLGGWSFGGLVALEMAQQLQAAGETVALLALVDTHAPVARPALDELSLLAAFGQNLGLSWRHLPLEPERLRQLTGRALLAQVLELARHAPGGAPSLELDQAERLFNVFKRHHEALRHYIPRPYAGPAVLLAASTPLDSGPPAQDLGWRTWLTGHLTVHQVPGDHYTLLRAPHVATLAERLSHALDTAGVSAL